MKALLFVLPLVFGSMAFAAPAAAPSGELQLSTYNTVLASPEFAKALSEANTKVNGKKIRIFYSTDNSSRMTKDSLKVLVVGRTESANGPLFQKAEFTATSLGSGMYRVRVTEIAVTTISEDDFVNFYN